MNKKTFVLPFLLIFFLTVNIVSSNVSSDYFPVYFSTGSGIGFQNYPYYVVVSVSTGNLNSSNALCGLHSGGGWFRFTSNETFTFSVSFSSGIAVKVAGDNGNEMRIIANSSSFPVYVNDYINIVWDFAPNIWFPISFIFGIVGLFSMFGGSLLGVSLLKKGEYSDALRFASIWVALGIALTVAWLWA